MRYASACLVGMKTYCTNDGMLRKENEFSISNHISFEKPETKFPSRSWTILFLQNRGQTNSTFIWKVLSAWACVKLWLNFLKMFMGKFAYLPMLTFQQSYFRVMNLFRECALREEIWEKNQTSILRFKNIFKYHKMIKKTLLLLEIHCLKSAWRGGRFYKNTFLQ